MTTPLEKLVRDALYEVAPELRGQALDPQQRFRDQFEFDSMDFVRFLAVVHRATGVDVPEADYAQLQSLEGCLAYLAPRLPPR